MAIKLLPLKVLVFWLLTLTTVSLHGQCPSTVSVTASATEICQGSEVTFSATVSGGQELAYQWQINETDVAGATTPTFATTQLANGDQVRVVVTSATEECSKPSTAKTITVKPLRTPTVTVSASKSSACPEEEIIFTASNTEGGTQPTFTWYIGTSTNPVQNGSSNIFRTTNLSNGQYVRVVMTSSVQCVTSSTVEASSDPITVLPAAPVLPNGIVSDKEGPLCPEDVVTYTVSGAQRAENFLWTLPSGWTGSSTTNSITATVGSEGGPITVRAENSCGTSELLSITETVEADAPNVPGVITGEESVCPGSTITYSVSPEDRAESYLWTIPSGWIGSSTTSSITVTAGTTGGVITVEATNTCGTSGPRSLDVEVKPGAPGQPEPVTGPTEVCPNSSQTYSIPSVPDAVAYIWTVPDGWTGTSTTPTLTVQTGSENTNGEISVRAVSECGEEGPVRTAQVNVKPGIPEITAALSGGTSVCPGTTESYSIPTVSGEEYIWTLPDGWSFTSGEGTGSIEVFTGTTGGTLSVIAKNDCGESAPKSITVSVTDPAPVMDENVSGPVIVCSSHSGLIYSIPEVQFADSYSWSVPDGWTITSGGETASITVTPGSVGGNISVVALNECGESGPSESLLIEVTTAAPDTPGNITSNLPSTAICPPYNGVNFSVATVSGATSYEWILPEGWEITEGDGTESITVNITSNAAYSGNQSVSVKAVNVCGSSSASTLSGIAIDEYVLADLGEDQTLCPSQDIITLEGYVAFGSNNSKLKITSLTTTGTGTLTNGANGKVNDFPYSYRPSESDLSVGEVTFTVVTETPGGACDAGEDSMTIFFKPLPTATITAVSPVCAGSTSTLTFEGTPNSEVTYSAGGNQYSVQIGSSGVATVETAVLNETTSFALNSTVNLDSPACTNTLSESVLVEVTPIPTASLSYDSPFCSEMTEAQDVTLTGTGAYQGGSFSQPEGLEIDPTSGAITPSLSTPGTYTVTYSTPASGGCDTVTASTEVVITPVPTAEIIYPGGPFCSSDTSMKEVQLTGTNQYQGGNFSAPAGLSIHSVTGAITPSESEAGTYTVTYTTPSASGCDSVTTTAEVTVTAEPTAEIIYPDAPFCQSDTSGYTPTLSGTQAYSGGTYTSSNGLDIDPNSGRIQPNTSTPGTYIVEYSTPSAEGCSAVSTTTEITITPTPFVEIAYSGPFCTSEDAVQPVTFNGGTGNFEGGTFTANPGGLTLDPNTGEITPKTSNPDTYIVTYTTPENGGCAPASFTTEVVITAFPQVKISYPTTMCTSESETYTVDFEDTAPQYQNGTFSGSPGLTINAAGTITPAESLPGEHLVTYSLPADAGCGEVEKTFAIEIFEKPFITTQPENAGICSTQPAAFEVVATGDDLSYEWFRTDGAEIVQATGIYTSRLSFQNATAVNAGEYFVVVSGAGSCAVTESDPVTLNVDENITIIKPAENQAFCDEDFSEVTFEFLAHANGEPLDFTWIKDGQDLLLENGKHEATVTGPTGEEGHYSGTLTIKDVNPDDNGVYAVRINGPEHFTCPEATSKTFSLDVSPLPDPPFTQNLTYCQGSEAKALTAEGNNLQWYDADGNPLPTAPVPETSVAGTFSYFVSQSDTCESDWSELIVTIDPTPPTPVVDTLFEYCLNETVSEPISVEPAEGSTLNWYGPDDPDLVHADTPQANTSSVGSTSYWVSQSIDGCESEKIEVIIKINPLPQIAIEASSDTICFGSTATLTASGADSYVWWADGTEVSTEPVLQVSPETATTYTLQGTDVKGCTNTTEITIYVDQPTNPGVLEAPESVCVTSPNGTLVLNETVGDILRWEVKASSAADWSVHDSGNTSNTTTFTGLTESTSFRAVVQNGVCAVAYAETTITIDPVPVGGKLAFPSIVTPENTGRIFMICEGETSGYAEPLSLSGHQGDIVSWNYRSVNSTTWLTVPGTNGNFTESSLSPSLIESLGITETTVFQVEISSGACSPNTFSRTAFISVIPTDIAPQPVSVDKEVVCFGDQVVLSAETGYTDGMEFGDSGAFDNASITNHDWRIRRTEDGPDLGFDTDANNTVFDRWKRGTPREFVTASTTEPYTPSEVLFDSGVGDGNKGFALVSGQNSSLMETPIFNIGAMDQAVLTFDQAYVLTPGASIKVEISRDGGNSYQDVLLEINGLASSGHYDDFGGGDPDSRPNNKIVIDLGEYLGENNLRLRFAFKGARSGDIWAVDNIIVPEGPRDVTLEWRDYTNSETGVLIGNTASVTYEPTKIGLNIFEVKTKLIYNSNGDQCDIAENAKDLEVFVYDSYTTSVSAETGSCGSSSAQLSAVVTNGNGEVVTNYPTPDGYIGHWVVTGGAYQLVDSDTSDSIDPINDPNATLTTQEYANYSVSWVLTPTATDGEGEVYPVPEGCIPDPNPLEIAINNCTTLDFDGMDDYVDLGTGYTGDLSIEAWIRPFARTSETGETDPSTGTIVSGPSFYLSMAQLSSYVVPGTRWYHIALTSSGNLFIDGILVDNIEVSAPTATDRTSIGAHWNATTLETESHFSGWIEEVRLWKGPIEQDQVRFLMNQRLQNAGNIGVEIPMPSPGLAYSELAGYFQLITDDIQDGNTPNLAGNAVPGRLHNMETMQENTAPLPYTTASENQLWTDESSTGPWTHWDVWDIPNANGVTGEPIEWNIVRTDHHLYSGAKDITVLGLKSETPEKFFYVVAPGETPDEYNSGQMLRVTHYLRLHGNIDLIGKSQLLQDVGSQIDPNSQGFLERDQQGTASSYNYNYWSSPVSPTTGNGTYSVSEVMLDGTVTATPQPLSFGGTYHYADGGFTTPRRISSYWLHSFNGTANDYFSWKHIGSTGILQVAEGYSMKGTSGSAAIQDPQNYTFRGKPNNGRMIRPIGKGQNYLIGNPYPSAMDADLFIKNHLEQFGNSTNTFNGTLYFWDHFAGATHYLEQYVGGYAMYNLSGGVIAIANDERINATLDEGSKVPGPYIPVGQGFFVNTMGHNDLATSVIDGGDIIFDNDLRVYKREGIEQFEGGDAVVFHSQERKGPRGDPRGSEEERMRIWVKFKSPMGYHRQLLVTADAKASNGYDLGYDAPLIEDNAEDMYWYFEEAEFVIQGVSDFNEDRELDLGVKIEEAGTLKVSIDQLQNIPAHMDIFIEDGLLQVTHNLRESDYQTSSEVGTFLERFKIVFKDKTAVEEEPVDEPEVGSFDVLYVNGTREVLVRNPELLEIERVYLNNLLGQQIHVYYDIPLEKEIRLPVEKFSSGVYVVKVHSEKGILTKKVILE